MAAPVVTPRQAAAPPLIRWWRRPWVGPLMVIVIVFLAFSLPPYLTLDPGQARVPAPADLPVHYPLLVGHIGFGAVALLTCGFQIWPWFRARHPRAHRIMGRLYVFAGVVPAALLAIPVGAVSPFGPVARVGNVLVGVLWLAVTITAFRMARRGHYAEHRRWMIRSFALTTSIVAARLWAPILALTVFANEPGLATAEPGDPVVNQLAGLTVWLGATVNLIVAQWWLDRSEARRAVMPSPRRGGDLPHTPSQRSITRCLEADPPDVKETP